MGATLFKVPVDSQASHHLTSKKGNRRAFRRRVLNPSESPVNLDHHFDLAVQYSLIRHLRIMLQ